MRLLKCAMRSKRGNGLWGEGQLTFYAKTFFCIVFNLFIAVKTIKCFQG